MIIIASGLAALIALLHIGILLAEMVFWTSTPVRKAFRTTPEFAAQSRVLAANQGLYNGFLAAGLIVGLLHPDPAASRALVLFSLACVSVAGLYGGLTASRRILAVQAAPALIALALFLMA